MLIVCAEGNRRNAWRMFAVAVALAGVLSLSGCGLDQLVIPAEDADIVQDQNQDQDETEQVDVDPGALNTAFNAAAERVVPSVVNVGIRQRRTNPATGESTDIEVGNGSGVVISDEGHILTNNHVVAGSDDITVLIQGLERDAEVVGRDPQTDLAVIRVVDADLPAAELVMDLDLEVGDWVIAVGSPFGLDKSVSAGIVSALGRTTTLPGPEGDLAAFTNLIQTDASVNPGNSGGALADLEGRVVGINTLIQTGGGTPQSAGVGFAIPIDFAMSIAEQLIETGDVAHPLLGVSMVSVTPHVAEQLELSVERGALVQDVQDGSGADRAGIQPGDVIVGMDDTDIASANDLFAFVRAQEIGDTVDVVVIRDGEELTLEATIGSD